MFTFLQEGNGQWSSRRVMSLLYFIIGVLTLPFSLVKFITLLANGWIAVLIFSPFVFCSVVSVLLLYFTTISDINSILQKFSKTETK